MSFIQIFISLKITDNTTRSALYALQNRMGFETVASLKRWQLWELDLRDMARDDALACVRNWVETTAIFMNPNKHHYQVIPSTTALLQSETVANFASSNGAVFVYDREDGEGERVFNTLKKLHSPQHSLQRLLRGTLWDVTWNQPSADEFKRLESIAVSTHRDSGIFANPHYQDYKVFVHS